jgi:hypothetical protein
MIRKLLSTSLCAEETFQQVHSQQRHTCPKCPHLSFVVRSPSHSCMSVVFTDVKAPRALSAFFSLDDNTESTCTEASMSYRVCPSIARQNITSSMYTTQGASFRANEKTAFAFFSLSPSHLFSITDASMLKNVAPPNTNTHFQICNKLEFKCGTISNTFRGDGFSQHRLPGARWTKQKNAFDRLCSYSLL